MHLEERRKKESEQSVETSCRCKGCKGDCLAQPSIQVALFLICTTSFQHPAISSLRVHNSRLLLKAPETNTHRLSEHEVIHRRAESPSHWGNELSGLTRATISTGRPHQSLPGSISSLALGFNAWEAALIKTVCHWPQLCRPLRPRLESLSW